MGTHSTRPTRRGSSGRGAAVGLVAAAATPLAVFGLAAPAFAGTTAADASDAAGRLVGLDATAAAKAAVAAGPAEVGLDVCADLSASLKAAQTASDKAPGDLGLRGTVADLQAKLGAENCTAANQAAGPTTTTSAAPPSSTTTAPPSTSTSKLPAPLGGTAGSGSSGSGSGSGSSSETIPGSPRTATSAPSAGHGQVSDWPVGPADTGDGSYP